MGRSRKHKGISSGYEHIQWTWHAPGQFIPIVERADDAQHRHAMYRWHVMDPIRFEKDLRVTIQALGWRREGRYLPGQHDICSVAYWYQTLPAAPFPPFPDRDGLEIV